MDSHQGRTFANQERYCDIIELNSRSKAFGWTAHFNWSVKRANEAEKLENASKVLELANGFICLEQTLIAINVSEFEGEMIRQWTVLVRFY